MTEFRKMRRFKQEISAEECVEVLCTAHRGILAFNGENGYPYAIPINQFYDKEDGKLYFHCAKQGLKLDLMEKDNKVCFTVIDEGYRKDGEWALNIRSVVCLGHLEVINDHGKTVLLQHRSHVHIHLGTRQKRHLRWLSKSPGDKFLTNVVSSQENFTQQRNR